MSWSKKQQQDDDPHGIQKLLNILRTQQDGDLTETGRNSSIKEDSKGKQSSDSGRHAGQSSIDRRSNADLLTDIQSNLAKQSQPQQEDLRFISFAQALPHLTKLSKDNVFLQKLLELKVDQDKLEQTLANERKDLIGSFSSSSGGNNGHSTQLQQKSSNVLLNWDRRALQRWDSLYAIQQEKLQQLGVPCFFATRDPGHIRKQQRVFDVLSGLLE